MPVRLAADPFNTSFKSTLRQYVKRLQGKQRHELSAAAISCFHVTSKFEEKLAGMIVNGTLRPESIPDHMVRIYAASKIT